MKKTLKRHLLRNCSGAALGFLIVLCWASAKTKSGISQATMAEVTLARDHSGDTITWNAERKLGFNDLETLSGQAVADTSAGFQIDYHATRLPDKTYSATVKAIFLKHKYWIGPGADAGTLSHAQGHFDLAENYARLLRKALDNPMPGPFDASSGRISKHKARKLFKKFERSLLDMEEIYDQETLHGKDTILQNEWNQRIADEMKALEKYK